VFGIVVMAISLIITIIIIIMNWNTLHECFQELDKAKKSWESHEQVVREPAFHINTATNTTYVSTTTTTTTTITDIA
jgi:archaellum component FlaF (FlaF/FlaG flagellin family)